MYGWSGWTLVLGKASRVMPGWKGSPIVLGDHHMAGKDLAGWVP